jgi:hypothetical protein
MLSRWRISDDDAVALPRPIGTSNPTLSMVTYTWLGGIWVRQRKNPDKKT